MDDAVLPLSFLSMEVFQPRRENPEGGFDLRAISGAAFLSI
jgi:hypothetical protein